MGVLDNIRDKAEEAKDTAEETIDKGQEKAKEKIDQGKETVDNVKDTVEEKTGVDIDRDGQTGSSGGGSSGGSSSSGSGSSSSGGGSSSSSSSSGSSSSGGSSSGSSSGSRVNPVKEMADNIRSSNKGKADFDNLNRQDIDNIQGSRTKLQEALNPNETKALESREQNLENREQASQQIETIRNSPEDANFTNSSGETLTRDEALKQAQEDRNNINQALDRQADAVNNAREINQQRSLSKEERVQQRAENINFNPSNEAATGAGSFILDVSERIPAYADTLFSDRGGQFLGSFIPGTDKTADGVVEERIASLQLKQDSQNPNINVAETSRLSSPPSLLVGGGVGGAGFRGVGKGIGQISSRGQTIWRGAGAVTGAAATGKEAGTAINQFNRGETTRAAGTVIDFTALSAGFMGGAKSFTNRFGAKKGNTEIDQFQVVKPGDPLTGRGKFNARTNIIDTQFRSPVQGQGPVKASLSKPFTASLQGPVKGSLQSPLTMNGLKPKLQNPLGNIGFRKPNADFSFQKPLNIQRQSSELNLRSPLETVTNQQTTSGRFGILNDQAQGTFNTITPSGNSRSGSFQAISIPKNNYRNSRGQRVEISGDVTRQQTESRFFRNFQDRTSQTKNIETSRESSSTKEIEDAGRYLASFDNVLTNPDQSVKAVNIASISRDGQTNFGGTKTFILGKKSGSGSSSTSGQGQGSSTSGGSSSSGGGQKTVQTGESSGQGSGIGSNIKKISDNLSSQVRDVATREASRTASNQRDSSLTTLSDTGSTSTTEMGRGNDADVTTFEGNIESNQELTSSQGTTQRTTQQETSQETTKNLGQNLVTSRGRPQLREKSNQLLDLEQGQSTRNRQRVIPENILSSTQRERLSQVPGLKQKNSSRVNERLGVGVRQINPARQRQRFRQTTRTGLTNIQSNARLQAFGVPSPGLDGKARNLGVTTSGSSNTPSNSRDPLELDWISSNYVDQKGGTPTFNLADRDARSTFGGVIAEEEQRRNNENLENKGFNSIW